MLLIVVETGPGQVTVELEGSLDRPLGGARSRRGGPPSQGSTTAPVRGLDRADHVDDGRKYCWDVSRDGARLTTAGAAMTELVRTIAETGPPSET